LKREKRDAEIVGGGGNDVIAELKGGEKGAINPVEGCYAKRAHGEKGVFVNSSQHLSGYRDFWLKKRSKGTVLPYE